MYECRPVLWKNIGMDYLLVCSMSRIVGDANVMNYDSILSLCL